ncbi:hypothetical protein BHE74_00040886 [Ensete ventricosum]|nr:hypothetical protein BHE74_00040886 [Ensete ventricosum]RZS16251.1 hypothetical protein BHM03_00048216 [Ensete ventricosum]
MDKVFDLVLQVVAFLSIMTVVVVEAAVALSVLFLESPGGGPREDSAHGRFWSSHFSATRASTATYWFALYSISSIVIGGHSTSDQKRRECLILVINAWITNDGCASGMALISFVKQARYGPRGSSSFYLIPRRDATVGFGRALARKLASNSLASWSKEWIEAGDRQLYHPRAITHKVVGKARHIMASDVSYKAICALNAATCSIGSEPPSYASSIESQK